MRHFKLRAITELDEHGMPKQFDLDTWEDDEPCGKGHACELPAEAIEARKQQVTEEVAVFAQQLYQQFTGRPRPITVAGTHPGDEKPPCAT